MKKIAGIVLVVLIIAVTVAGHADAVSRKDYANEIMENSIALMKAYRDFYKEDPTSFSDAHLVAMYNYYKLYMDSLAVKTAESSISLGKVGEMLINKETMKTTSDVAMLLEKNWSKWLSGELERDRMIMIIIAFIDGVEAARAETGK